MQHRRAFACLSPVGLLFACYSPHGAVVADGSDTDPHGESNGSSAGEADDASGSADTTGTGGPATATSDATATDGVTETGAPVCGDGMIEGDELCDDGVNDGSYGGCMADCASLGPHCGDDVAQADEACDDGDDVNGNGCNVDCVESGTVLWTRTLESGALAVIDVDADSNPLVGNATLVQLLDADGNEGWNFADDPPGATSAGLEAIAFDGTAGWMVGGSGAYPNESTNAWWRPFSEDGLPGTTGVYDNPAHASDALRGIVFNDDGQFYTCGDSNRFDGQGSNIWLRKHDVDGEEMWTQSYDGGADDYCRGVGIGSDGYVVVGGYTIAPGDGSNAWIRKYGPEGTVEWTRSSTSDGDTWDWAEDIAIGPDLSVAVIGNEGYDIWLRLYDADGNVEWTERLGDLGACVGEACGAGNLGNGVAIDSQGAVVAVGRLLTDDHQSWIAKYDAGGNELWTQLVSPPDAGSYQQAKDVVIAEGDTIVVVGAWDETSSGGDVLGWIQKCAP